MREEREESADIIKIILEETTVITETIVKIEEEREEEVEIEETDVDDISCYNIQ